jgi:dephospho-CoA kinase
VLHVGLTGGLASGKSEVARRLTELGAVVFDADRIVAEMYGPGAPGSEAARELFGEAVLDASGRVDRARIAAIVFADPRRRHELEARIHPLVVRETERRFEEAEKRGVRVGVAEASQLLESGMEGRFDRVLLVVAPETQRIRRWEQKGGDPDDGRWSRAGEVPGGAAATARPSGRSKSISRARFPAGVPRRPVPATMCAIPLASIRHTTRPRRSRPRSEIRSSPERLNAIPIG